MNLYLLQSPLKQPWLSSRLYGGVLSKRGHFDEGKESRTFASTAAYAAVLVVFVGGDLATPKYCPGS